MDDSCLLTVVVPVYNGLPYLAETIDSLLSQTCQCFCVYVVNDGSVDGSGEYLNSITDPRVRVFHQENNGLCQTLNDAMASVETEYIARLDQDDIALPHRLQVQLEFLQNNPEFDAVLGNINRISGDGYEFGSHLDFDSEFVRYSSLEHGSVVHSTLMMRRCVFHKIGGYRESYYPVDDFDMLMRMEELFRVAILSEVIVKYRIHGGAGSFSTVGAMDWKTRWAQTNSKLRKCGKPEMPQDIFVAQDNSRPWLERAIELKGMYGRLLFRIAGLKIGNREKIAGFCCLAFSILLAPKYSLSRLKRMLR